MIKTLVLTLLLTFSSVSYGQVSGPKVSACLNDEFVELVAAIQDYQKAGYPKHELISKIPQNFSNEKKATIVRAVLYVYEKTHEINPVISALTECLNK